MTVYNKQDSSEYASHWLSSAGEYGEMAWMEGGEGRARIGGCRQKEVAALRARILLESFHRPLGISLTLFSFCVSLKVSAEQNY